MVSLNFSRADLIEVIHVLAQHLKLNYTIDPEVKGTVTIYSSEPLRREDLLPIFHQVLRMNGAVAVKIGELYRIMPIKDGKGLAAPVAPGREEGLALQIVPVRFFAVSEMKRLLTPFVTPGGEILDYPRGNFLILVDLPSNIQRLMEIRDLIDVSVFSGTRMEIYAPRVASAEELAAEMTKIMQTYASSAAQAEGFAAQFVPIPRINQILVISHSEAAWTYVKRWLERIDIAGEGPGRRIFIYPVENGKASELADILNQALGQAPISRREPSRTLQDLHRGSPAAPSATGARPQLSPLGGSMGINPGAAAPPAGAFAVVPAPSETPRPSPAPPVGVTPPPAGVAPPPPTAVDRPEEQLRVVPDPATNSLVIYGTVQEFQSIRNILKDLDVIPRQVLMDVLVAEISLRDDFSFGIEYEIMRRTGVSIFGQTFGSQGAARSGIFPAPPTTAGALTQFGSGLSGVAGRSNAVRAFINALATDSRVKVLSSPSVLAADNRPARIQVGSEVPVLTSQQVTATTTGVLVNNVQYRNTGVILTIIPQVNSQGLVHLQVKQEVSDIGVQSFGATGSPSFTTRDAETTAVVQDGETLVIGGIISERKNRDRIGIPFLMDIPVLGHFFGSTTEAVDRTELVMLITPHVIRNLEEARRVTRDFQERLSIVAQEIERMRREEAERDRPARR
jgi:general secretion pathway protein D